MNLIFVTLLLLYAKDHVKDYPQNLSPSRFIHHHFGSLKILLYDSQTTSLSPFLIPLHRISCIEIVCTLFLNNSSPFKDVQSMAYTLFVEFNSYTNFNIVLVSCLKAAEEAKVPLLVAFNRRFDETHSSLKRAVTNGEVGNIQLLTISSRDSPRPSDEYLAISGGIFHDMAIHDIDMALWLMNEHPTSVFTYGKAFDPYYTTINDVDTVAISMQFPSGEFKRDFLRAILFRIT